jgi:hypothetical protein
VNALRVPGAKNIAVQVPALIRNISIILHFVPLVFLLLTAIEAACTAFVPQQIR